MNTTDTAAVTVHDAAELALPAPAVEATRRYLQTQGAPATLRAYQSDFTVFTTWCAADAGVAVATIRRRAAAIHFRHASAQIESPNALDAGRGCLERHPPRAGRRPGEEGAGYGAAPGGDGAAAVPGQHAGLARPRAVAAGLLPTAGAFRRSELVGLNVEDLKVLPQDLKVTIRRSKTAQAGAGQVIATGPVLRRVRKVGRVGQEVLSDHAMADIVEAYAERAGFRAEDFSGHSLRAGYLDQRR